MKKLLLIALLAGSISASAFDVHIFTGSGSETQTITNATKIVFGKDQTIVTNNAGTDFAVANSSFAHLGFTASTGVSDVITTEDVALTFTADAVIYDAGNAESIEIFSLSGAVAAKSQNSNVCSISTLSKGTYIARVKANGNIIVKKFFKKA